MGEIKSNTTISSEADNSWKFCVKCKKTGHWAKEHELMNLD